MLVGNDNFREAAHIGEEMLTNIDLDMDSKCMSVESTVGDGVFTLEKALKLYKVPKETYFAYVAKNHAASINTQLRSDSQKDEVIFTINVIEKIFEISFAAVSSKLVAAVTSTLNDFSKDVEKEKISLK